MLTKPLDSFLQKISAIAARFGMGGNSGVAMGSQRPISNWVYGASGDTLVGRNYDLEIPIDGGLVRDAQRLRNLIEIRTHNPEVAKAIAIQRDDTFSSEHGDDQGFWVSDWIDRRNTVPIDPQVKDLLDEFIYQHFGAEQGKPTVAEALTVGDSFSEIVFTPDLRQIERLIRLPVGEMFRIEDDFGYLVGFEQRQYLHQEARSRSTRGIFYNPMQIVHWRYQPGRLYGQSLFEESIPDWEDLKEGEIDLAKACREAAVNPIHHELAPGSDSADKADYEARHKEAKRNFLITDLYTLPGVKVNRVTGNPNIDPLIERVLMRRKRLAMSCRTPSYLLGIQEDAAKQLSGQPASAYARHIASVRQMYSQGVNFVLDLHLLLNGVPPDKWRYKLVYPEIVINPFNQPTPSTKQEQTV